MSQARQSATIYLRAIIATGSVALLYALGTLVQRGDWSWLWLALVTTAAGMLVIKIPLSRHQGHSISVAVAECFIPVGLISYGVDTAVALAALVAVMGCLRSGLRRWDRFAFNVAQFSFVTWLAGQLYVSFRAPGTFWSFHNLLLIAFCGLLFFLLNSGAVATAIALSQGKSIPELWYRHFAGLSPHEVLSFLAALAFLLSFRPEHSTISLIWLGLGAMLMLLGFFYKQLRPRSLAARKE